MPRQSIIFQRRWMRGSSPRMTALLRGIGNDNGGFFNSLLSRLVGD
jgi:hypothetical protein